MQDLSALKQDCLKRRTYDLRWRIVWLKHSYHTQCRLTDSKNNHYNGYKYALIIQDLHSSPISFDTESLQWDNLTHASKRNVNSVKNDRLITAMNYKTSTTLVCIIHSRLCCNYCITDSWSTSHELFAKLHDANITQPTFSRISIGYRCMAELTTRLPSSVIEQSNCNNLHILLVYSRHTDSRVFWGHLRQTYCQHSLH